MKWVCDRFVFDGIAAGCPLQMGILNVTPDSFSDGGEAAGAKSAIEKGLRLRRAGADIIDVGGESTRPGAAPVSADEEKRRVLPVIEALAAEGVAVSVDTMKPAVMRAALRSGAVVLNDVGGFTDPDAAAVAADSDCGVVIMHMKGAPATMQQSPQYDDVVGEVGAFLARQQAALVAAGVGAERICVDPGIGFGKTRAHNFALLSALPAIHSAPAPARPVVIAISRKSLFAGHPSLPPDHPPSARDAISAETASALAQQTPAIIRTHITAATQVVRTR